MAGKVIIIIFISIIINSGHTRNNEHGTSKQLLKDDVLSGDLFFLENCSFII